MPVIQPAKPRHRQNTQDEALIIRIPARKDYLGLGFAIGMSLGGLFMEIVLGSGFFMLLHSMWLNFSQSQTDLTTLLVISLFLLAMLGWVTVMTLTFVFGILWQLAGQEIITVNADRLKVRLALWRWGEEAEYLAAQIKDFRVAASTPDDETGLAKLTTIGNPQRKFLAFDYGAKTYHFCGNVAEAEAKQIYAAIVAHFPQYAKMA